MIEPLQANWQVLSDIDIIALLHNSEGSNSTDRALFIEAARRIEAQQAAIAQAVAAERKACKIAVINSHDTLVQEMATPTARLVLEHAAAAIRARSNGAGGAT